MTDPKTKIKNLQQAVEWRRELASRQRKLVVTNGCFDILHRGHAEYLREARLRGDALLILLNSDESISELKGPSRPVCRECDRAYLLACMEFVDAVLVFRSQRCTEELRALKPDIYVKGGDYTPEKLNREEYGALMECHAELAFIPFVPGYSTTAVIQKMSEKS